ncbi:MULTISPECIES: hypothetical protein [unclassified Rathayibacter]|uniref:hypothetical protein n=1 Tax=unclassified Rathayibacter TaxID=2609250 RepID=UPI00188B4951|nr:MULTISPECIES: hypothetical protein [unclassified Rathayibacter]MBF4461838.1 hypothetical protein [Rathayibacter sp. VKM Ac-2879]MBF4503251.1 hypothetical protein [Rathayibacter sp. VKM Ac-2878]
MIASALRTEALRLRSDRPLAGLALVALVLGLSILLAVPENVREAPASARSALFDALAPSLLTTAAVVAGLYGAFRYTSDLERGVLARQLGFVGRLPLLCARAVMAAIGGALLAAVSSVAAVLAFRAVAASDVGVLELLPAGVLVGVSAALWGLAVGVVIGRHVPALVAVSGVLAASLPLSEWQPDARLATPLGAWLASVAYGGDRSADLGLALAAGVLWLIVAAVLAVVVVLRRDIVSPLSATSPR